MGRLKQLTNNLGSLLFLVLSIPALYFAKQHSYLLFHTLAEMFSIVVAAGVFMLAWNSRRFLQNGYMLWVGIALFFVAGLDLVHTLAYRGMGVLATDTNEPTQLWVAARYLQALAFLTAPFFVRKKPDPHLTFAGFAGVAVLLLLSIFFWDIFPDAYVEEEGRLTVFKVVSEYIICGILVGAIAFLVTRRRLFDTYVLRLIVVSLLFTVASEFSFTLYSDPFGLINMVGHYLKIVAFFLVYKAVIETGLTRPYNLLFKELKDSEEALRRINETLELRVGERTALAEERALQLHDLAAELAQAEQRERRRLAQLLHDHLQQLLVGAALHLRALKSKLKAARDQASMAIVEDLLQQSINASRSLSMELSPPVLQEEGLPAALQWLAGQMESKYGLKVEYLAVGDWQPEGEDLRSFLFQAVRELLFNIVKHAKVKRARICMGPVEGLGGEIVVEDRGVGFPLDAVEGSERPGFGLFSIRRRMEVFGGRLLIESSPGKGTRMHLWFPSQYPEKRALSGSR
jgi:signal transduction histidine kinase